MEPFLAVNSVPERFTTQGPFPAFLQPRLAVAYSAGHGSYKGPGLPAKLLKLILGKAAFKLEQLCSAYDWRQFMVFLVNESFCVLFLSLFSSCYVSFPLPPCIVLLLFSICLFIFSNCLSSTGCDEPGHTGGLGGSLAGMPDPHRVQTYTRAHTWSAT